MAQLLNRIGSALLRIVLALFGLAMFFGVMFVGAVVGLAVVIWALLRGRRGPPIKFAWRGPVDFRTRGQAARAGKIEQIEIVDIEAREVETGSAAARVQPADRRPD